jgi:hypothetical protein
MCIYGTKTYLAGTLWFQTLNWAATAVANQLWQQQHYSVCQFWFAFPDLISSSMHCSLVFRLFSDIREGKACSTSFGILVAIAKDARPVREAKVLVILRTKRWLP